MILRGYHLVFVWFTLTGGNIVGYAIRDRLVDPYIEQIMRTSFDMAWAFAMLYVVLRWIIK